MSLDPRQTWLKILERSRQKLQSSRHFQNLESAEAPTDLNEFQLALNALCKHYNQARYNILSNFLRQFQPFLVFCSLVDSAGNFSSPESLTSVFLPFAVALIENAFYYNVSLADLETTLRPYSATIPNFGADLALHMTLANVQEPLQHIYSEYIACFSLVIKQFATHVPPFSFTPIQTRFDSASEIFTQARHEWGVAMKYPHDLAEKERRELTSSSRNSDYWNEKFSGASVISAGFRFVRALGRGNHSEVSEVMESSTKQLFALKLISMHPASNKKRSELLSNRVRKEVFLMQKLHHEHIATVLFYTRDQHELGVVMLPVAQGTLQSFFTDAAKGSRGGVKSLATWFGCLASALTYAHSCAVMHECISPSNILIKGDRPYLSAFGRNSRDPPLGSSQSSRVLENGMSVYRAPDTPARIDADVFALGCVFSEMLTVRALKTLESFREYRKDPSSAQPYAFRNNLLQVQDWLNGLSNKVGLAYYTQVCAVTATMLRPDPTHRSSAATVVKAFLAIPTQAEQLFCQVCYKCYAHSIDVKSELVLPNRSAKHGVR